MVGLRRENFFFENSPTCDLALEDQTGGDAARKTRTPPPNFGELAPRPSAVKPVPVRVGSSMAWLGVQR